MAIQQQVFTSDMSAKQQTEYPSKQIEIDTTQTRTIQTDKIQMPQYLHANIINNDPYICCNCKRLLTYPMKYQPCQHLVCNECGISYTDSCPQCQNLVISVDDDELIMKDILQQQLQCECGTILDLKSYIQSHLPQCEQALIACPNGCNQCFTHSQKQMHLQQQCPKRMVSCQHCGAILSFEESQCHLEHCHGMKINCQYCNQSVLRSEMQKHLQNCQEININCPLCQVSIKRGELEKHFGDLQSVGHHMYALYQQFNNMATKVQIRYEELTHEIHGIEQKLTQFSSYVRHNSFGKVPSISKQQRTQNQIQSGISQSSDVSIDIPANQDIGHVAGEEKHETKRVIRTSLRVLPGQQAGTDRVNSYMLIIPDEVYANNDYRVNSVPPTQNSYLEIVNTLTDQKHVIEPTVKKNQIYYRLSLPQGQYQVYMKDLVTHSEQDSSDLTVLQQSFTNGLSHLTQQFQYQTPMRHFFNVTKQNKQTFYLKVLFCNCFLGIGSGNDNDRTVEDFKMICDDGILVSRQDGKIQKTQHDVRFIEGDIIEIQVNQQQENVQVNCRDKSVSLYFPREWNLYLEIVDASVVLM